MLRPVRSNAALIKQLPDIGAQSLLLPMIETPEQAADAVATRRYPPRGIRDVGSALAPRWNCIPDYLATVAQELCVLVQVKNKTGLGNLAAIANTGSIDGVFFGLARIDGPARQAGRASRPGRDPQRYPDGARYEQSCRRAGARPRDCDGIPRSGCDVRRGGYGTGLFSKAASDLSASYKQIATLSTAPKGGY
uniref:HpcH/HpaI aldolase/citrate lyase domain-containing protein n=1 Tax=Paraburkholderia sprentiae WSM5005 TaxID=754502 RepID=A0A1I9YQE7_9BURK